MGIIDSVDSIKWPRDIPKELQLKVQIHIKAKLYNELSDIVKEHLEDEKLIADEIVKNI